MGLTTFEGIVGLPCHDPNGTSGRIYVNVLVGTSPSESVSITCETGVRFSISPPSHDFGNVSVGTTTPEFVFTVTNVGGVTSTGVQVLLTGNVGTLYGLSTQDCPANLAPGASCSIGVIFSPPLVRPFLDVDLRVSNGLSGTGRAIASLSGSGVTPP